MDMVAIASLAETLSGFFGGDEVETAIDRRRSTVGRGCREGPE